MEFEQLANESAIAMLLEFQKHAVILIATGTLIGMLLHTVIRGVAALVADLWYWLRWSL